MARKLDEIYSDINLHKAIIQSHNEAIEKLISEAQEQAVLKDGDIVLGGVDNRRYMIIGKPRLEITLLHDKANLYDLVYKGRIFGKGGSPLKWNTSNNNRDIYQTWIEEGKFKKVDI